MHHFKSMVIEGTWHPAKIGPYILKSLNFVLSVGLSGFIIVMVNFYLDRNKSDVSEKKLTEISENLKKILIKIEQNGKTYKTTTPATHSQNSKQR